MYPSLKPFDTDGLERRRNSERRYRDAESSRLERWEAIWELIEILAAVRRLGRAARAYSMTINAGGVAGPRSCFTHTPGTGALIFISWKPLQYLLL